MNPLLARFAGSEAPLNSAPMTMHTQDCQNTPVRLSSENLGDEIKVFMERHRERVEELIAKGDENAGEEASHLWARSWTSWSITR